MSNLEEWVLQFDANILNIYTIYLFNFKVTLYMEMS